ncbi:MAG TPA: DNA/RNA non-specific endonuclease [Kofleriaceae bacterium]|nr:DNA/RNA non-specific endonuclease [Kofleriaceae bacterium]
MIPGLVVSSAIVAATGCATGMPGGDDDGSVEVAPAATLSEGFEAGTKTAYAVADVALGTGTWTMDDALIGTLSSDVKTGTQSGRIRNSGTITMKFDRTTGAGTVTIHHASFSSDASSTWGLFESQNSGSTWSQVGTSRSTTGGSFSTATFTVNLAGTIRFQVRKLDGSANRINVDDISITDFSGTGGGGGGGGGTGGGAKLSVHTTLGIPAPTSTTTANAFLSVKADYVVSYNGSRKVPNWVSWELNPSYLGSIDRQNDFRPDDTFPSSEPQAQLTDYSGSGFDRGHMCPSADRTLTVTANSQTFYLTNMVPQSANNNRGPWEKLEEELRTIVDGGKEVFIIAGGVFSTSSRTIGTGVSVPDKTFKVAVVLDAVGQGPANVTTSTRVIAVMMPNSDSLIGLTDPWRNFRVSVDAIEAATGDDFLSDVDPAVQAVIEARVDNQ